MKQRIEVRSQAEFDACVAAVSIMIHGENPCRDIFGGKQTSASPCPTNGAEWCEEYGIDPAKCDFVVEGIDRKIFDSLQTGGKLDMAAWHMCETTHCRAGWAIIHAGLAGAALEKKHGAEMAGRMIYAVSRLDKQLPDFFASNEAALADITACAGVA